MQIVGRREEQALRRYFAEQRQVLLPLAELVQDARASIDELMNAAARTFVEQLLETSAQEVAGARLRDGNVVRFRLGTSGASTGFALKSARP